MLKKKISVQINANLPLDDHTIMFGETLIKSYKIPTGQSLSIHFGAARHQVKAVSVPQFDGMRISHNFSRKTGLTHGSQLRLKFKPKSQTLVIGPLLGVMLNRIRSHTPDRPFGPITSFCKELSDACHAEGGFVYFFSPDSLSTRGQTIEGWNYSGHWQKSDFPIPDVIYNRLTSRILENKTSVQHFMKEVKSRHKTQIFNEKFLNKTEVFQALKKDKTLLKYLPESYPLRSYSTLKSMCSRHSSVFIKPNLGSLGKGIIRVTRQTNQSYVCHFANINGSKKQTYSSTSQLFKTIANKMKIRRYQIQQGLNLISIGSRPIDFRALVQKNNKNEWQITSIVARIAGNHHFVSNLARGGTLSTVKDALSKANLPSGHVSVVNARLRKGAEEIAKGIERQIPRHFGELGVDLAVDVKGRVWLLEVNSKPSKNDNTPLSDNKIRPSVKQVAKYVSYLSGY
jgi:glutathione synthase/RimK-type ligase-like ATP-grasp enzyme